MLLNFNQFSHYINDIREFEDNRSELFNFGVEITGDSIFDRMEKDLVEVVVNCAPKEKQPIVSWWMWENSFGKAGYLYYYKDNYYSLDTIEDLWSFIQE